MELRRIELLSRLCHSHVLPLNDSPGNPKEVPSGWNPTPLGAGCSRLFRDAFCVLRSWPLTSLGAENDGESSSVTLSTLGGWEILFLLFRFRRRFVMTKNVTAFRTKTIFTFIVSMIVVTMFTHKLVSCMGIQPKSHNPFNFFGFKCSRNYCHCLATTD